MQIEGSAGPEMPLLPVHEGYRERVWSKTAVASEALTRRVSVMGSPRFAFAAFADYRKLTLADILVAIL